MNNLPIRGAIVALTVLLALGASGCDGEDVAASGETQSATTMATQKSAAATDPKANSSAPSPVSTEYDAPPTTATSESAVGVAGAQSAPEAVSTPQPAPVPTQRVVGEGPQAPERANWKPAAEAFSAAWANPEGGKEAWLKRMKPYMTAELAKSFEATIMQNVYNDKFNNMNTLEEHNAYVIFESGYEKNGNLVKGMIQLQGTGEWLVDSIAPADE